MNTDFRQLMAKPVIRLEDVSALRAHIELKHPDYDSQIRAELMAEGINRMLDSALTGMDTEHKDSIKKKLISENLIAGRQSILKLDVLNRILALDMKPDQLMAKTWGWYVLNTGHSVTLTDFVEQASPYLPHRVREAIRDAEARTQSYQSAVRSLDTEDDLPETQLSAPARPFSRAAQHLKAYRITRRGWITLASAAVVAALAFIAVEFHDRLPATPAKVSVTDSRFAPPSDYRVKPAGCTTLPTVFEKPEYLKYRNISIDRLTEYLERKNSMLLTSDYLNQLMTYSLEKDINPLLLVAIIGQEQNYVPVDHRFADRIIKNPFNIYGSWQTHPVGFTASMKEACYTINLALTDRPLYIDPFVLINSRYAEDPQWYLGVKVIFRDLMALAGD